MITKLVKSVFGSANDRILKKEQIIVNQINSLEDKYKPLSDSDLKAQTKVLQERLQNGETENDIIADAFAVVREASKRTLGQRHYDVQLIGGIMLHRGNVIEMKTGEGKTLMATLAVYLNALSGKGVHVVTVNDYLAERDSTWMGQVYRFLGLTCGCIINKMDDEERRNAYACDITYGTNNEFGFDYLRDNMKFKTKEMVQRDFNYAIVDEVDSILIDEARTPLIISGAAEDSSELYVAIDKLMPQFKPEHYTKDEKDRNVMMTDAGVEFAEKLLHEVGIIQTPNLYDIANASVLHHVDQALHAHLLYQKDVHYLIRDGQVYLIDEFTGRVMEGRRFSGGLHQALEAKEGVRIQQENQTLASITYQNYFRMYPKLAGMTGTALTEADEFAEIYKLSCVEIPTNKPIARKDYDDEIYRTAGEKYKAIAKQIKIAHDRGQPVLVGTVSIEKSEYLAHLLEKEHGLKNLAVLNAKFHENEAKIVAQAGVPGAITIATNMAGRGTDIQLGGNLDMRVTQELGDNPSKEDVAKIAAEIAEHKVAALKAGGLYVIGTERHESRRIDNQLRGRSGRQGDPGASRFYLSLEDDLMRIFGSERLDSILRRFGLKEDEAITHPWVSRALEKAQQKVEARNFEIRKNLLKYDDIINEQRKAIYEKRNTIMSRDDMSAEVDDMVREVVESIAINHIPYNTAPEEWNIKGMDMACREILGMALPFDAWVNEEGLTEQMMFDRILENAKNLMANKRNKYHMIIKSIEKSIMLETLDAHWKDHLSRVDHLRRTIGLQSYAQKDPLHEYKKEAFKSFEEMMYMISQTSVMYLCKMEFSAEDLAFFEQRQVPQDYNEIHAEPEHLIGGGDQTQEEPAGQAPFRHQAGAVDPNNVATWGKVSRNEPCPCGSGKKFKHCHGKLG